MPNDNFQEQSSECVKHLMATRGHMVKAGAALKRTQAYVALEEAYVSLSSTHLLRQQNKLGENGAEIVKLATQQLLVAMQNYAQTAPGNESATELLTLYNNLFPTTIKDDITNEIKAIKEAANPDQQSFWDQLGKSIEFNKMRIGTTLDPVIITITQYVRDRYERNKRSSAHKSRHAEALKVTYLDWANHTKETMVNQELQCDSTKTLRFMHALADMTDKRGINKEIISKLDPGLESELMQFIKEQTLTETFNTIITGKPKARAKAKASLPTITEVGVEAKATPPESNVQAVTPPPPPPRTKAPSQLQPSKGKETKPSQIRPTQPPPPPPPRTKVQSRLKQKTRVARRPPPPPTHRNPTGGIAKANPALTEQLSKALRSHRAQNLQDEGAPPTSGRQFRTSAPAPAGTKRTSSKVTQNPGKRKGKGNKIQALKAKFESNKMGKLR